MLRFTQHDTQRFLLYDIGGPREGIGGANRLNVLNDLNTALAVNPEKRKHLRRIEHTIERYQIVIGVLEADVARAVVDRLNTAKIK